MSDFECIDLSEPKHFSMIPYVIHEIGLDVYEIAVYCAIKRSAGEKGDCTKSKANLAKQSGNISTRKLVQVIQSLCQINPFLKKPLIVCQKRDHEYGDSDTNLLKVVDIWIENIALCRENERSGAKMTLGGAPYSPPHAPYSPQGVHAMHGGGAPHAPKEQPIKKNPIKKNNDVDAVGFFDCLKEDNRLNDQQRKDLMQFSEERIKLALEFSKNVEIKKTLISTLVWHCMQESPPKSEKKKNFKKEVREIFKNGSFYNGAECFVDDVSIAFQRGMNHQSIKNTKPYYEEEFMKILKNFDINIEKYKESK